VNSRNKRRLMPVTRAGDDIFIDDEFGRIFSFEGWKEHQEAAVAWGKVAGAALEHMSEGFTKEGGAWGDVPAKGTEAVLTAIDGLGNLATGLGRYTAKAWRSDEEEDRAAYDAYLRMTLNFNRRYAGKSLFGDFHRAIGTGAGDEADAMIDPQKADSWGMVLDPTWLIPGGAAVKAMNIVKTGAKGSVLAAALTKMSVAGQKYPMVSAMAGHFSKAVGSPASSTVKGTGKIIEVGGNVTEWTAKKFLSSKTSKVVVGGTAAYYAFDAFESDDSANGLLKAVAAGATGVAAAKGLPAIITRAGSLTKGTGQAIHAVGKSSELGLTRAANLGIYSDRTAKAMKVVDNAGVNFLLRNSNKLANLGVHGAAFGAGMGYVVAGEEGAAAGLGIGVLGGPIGGMQGKFIKIGRGVSFQKPDGKGGWMRVDVRNLQEVPYRDLTSNWMAEMPQANREALANWAADKGPGADKALYGVAMVEMYARGWMSKVDEGTVGDLKVLYFENDAHLAAEFPGKPEWLGEEGAYVPGDAGQKPFAFVNLEHAVDPLYTLTHEIFHPDWKTADPDNPINAFRGEMEGVFFGIKDIDGNDIVKGMFDEDQFLSLEKQYLDRLHGDDAAAISSHMEQDIQVRRSFIAGEMISDAGGMFALAADGDLVKHANQTMRNAKVDDFTQKYFKFSMDKFRVGMAGKTRSALEKLGITFDAGGDPIASPLFRDPKNLTEYRTVAEGVQAVWDFETPQGKPLTNSPEINRIVADYVLNKNKLHEHLSVRDTSEGEVVVTAKQILAADSPQLVARMKNSGIFALDSNGDVIFEGGRPKLLTRPEQKRIGEAYSAAVHSALESVEVGEGEIGVMPRGKKDDPYFSGRYMTESQRVNLKQSWHCLTRHCR